MDSIPGLVVHIAGENRVCFANVSVGNSITSAGNDCAAHAGKYLTANSLDPLDLKTILILTGAVVVGEIPAGDFCNPAPEALDKTTILNLIKPT